MTNITALLLWPRPFDLCDADEFLPAKNWTLIVQHPSEPGWRGLSVKAVLDPWSLIYNARRAELFSHWAPLAECGPVVGGFAECRRWVRENDK